MNKGNSNKFHRNVLFQNNVVQILSNYILVNHLFGACNGRPLFQNYGRTGAHRQQMPLMFKFLLIY